MMNDVYSIVCESERGDMLFTFTACRVVSVISSDDGRCLPTYAVVGFSIIISDWLTKTSSYGVMRGTRV